jgi:hypothetical protein
MVCCMTPSIARTAKISVRSSDGVVLGEVEAGKVSGISAPRIPGFLCPCRRCIATRDANAVEIMVTWVDSLSSVGSLESSNLTCLQLDERSRSCFFMRLVMCSSQAPPPIATMTANGKLRGPSSLRRNSRHLNCLRAFCDTMRGTRDGVKDAAAETRPARIVILAGWEARKCGRPSVNKNCHIWSRWKELTLIANARPVTRCRPVLMEKERDVEPGQAKTKVSECAIMKQ